MSLDRNKAITPQAAGNTFSIALPLASFLCISPRTSISAARIAYAPRASQEGSADNAAAAQNTSAITAPIFDIIFNAPLSFSGTSPISESAAGITEISVTVQVTSLKLSGENAANIPKVISTVKGIAPLKPFFSVKLLLR